MERGEDSLPVAKPTSPGGRGPCEGASCRICLGTGEDGKLFSPCRCSGTMKYVHVDCLQRWRAEAPNANAYFRCEQCRYRYSLRRVTASGFLGLPFVVPLITTFIMASGWALASVLCYVGFGPETLSDTFALPPHYACAVAGLCTIGLIGFSLMALAEGGPDMRDLCCQGHVEGGGCCNWCCAGDCVYGAWDLPASAEGCLALAAVLLVVVVVGYGVLRTVAFVYAGVHALAVGTRDRLATVVLEVGADANTPPPSPQPKALAASPLLPPPTPPPPAMCANDDGLESGVDGEP
ncbi:hypothetical protein JKP88DRAFT_199168 [Tribonema minus]|uniref:RING-CH-type domain-containing protein n=1 Tax=Tribonema minus TaxID=303371 RepID=A0A836CGB1_9STRA|nr:hypothetical protein JKP88DRAFT_199168 [Tribonema minus]